MTELSPPARYLGDHRVGHLVQVGGVDPAATEVVPGVVPHCTQGRTFRGAYVMSPPRPGGCRRLMGWAGGGAGGAAGEVELTGGGKTDAIVQRGAAVKLASRSS